VKNETFDIATERTDVEVTLFPSEVDEDWMRPLRTGSYTLTWKTVINPLCLSVCMMQRCVFEKCARV